MKDTPFHTEEYKGYKISLFYDHNPVSPREWDNLGTMACFHKRYVLGDENTLSGDEVVEIERSSNYLSLPLYMYDHSGITISAAPFHDPWDSGRLGLIYVSLDKVRKEYNVIEITPELKEKVLSILQSEVKTYDCFIQGDVCGYIIDSLVSGEENIDSCWGYYSDDDAITSAKETIDHLLNQSKEAHHANTCSAHSG